MTPVVSVFCDYVCPFCFLAEGPVGRAAKAHGAAVDWRPFELRPEPAPTLRPEDPYLPRVWREAVLPLAGSMGVPIRLPTVSPQPYTRLAAEGFQHAKAAGRAAEYNARVFRAFFQEDRDIGDPEVLAAVARDVGLDPAEFRADLDGGTYRDCHNRAMEDARDLAIESVPTIIVGRRRLAGLPRAEVLDRLLAEAAGGPPTAAPEGDR